MSKIPDWQKSEAYDLVKKLGYTAKDIRHDMRFGVSRNRAVYLHKLATQRIMKERNQKTVFELLDSKPDLVNSPAHYTKGGIEVIDFIEAKGLGYKLGNVIKYICRADDKGNPVQDLEKAEWYLKREIAERKKEV